MARSTVSTIIERMRRQLASSIRMEINTFGALLPADEVETTVTLSYDLANSLRSGAVLSAGRELMRVISVNVNAKEAYVIRAWQDSVLEVHAIGDEILINPRFTRFDIFDALIEEINSWSPDIFYASDHQFTIADDTQTVELPATFLPAIGVIRVRGQNASAASSSTTWPQMEFRLQRGAVGIWDQAVESGMQVRLLTGGTSQGRVAAGKVLVTLAMPFPTAGIAETTDLVTDLGMADSMLDVLQLGIKYRLMGDDEFGATGRTTQDEPRRAEEVPPGAALQVSGSMLQRYERRKSLEVGRLRALYPMEQW